MVRDQVVKISGGWLAICNGELLCVCEHRDAALRRLSARQGLLESKAAAAARAAAEMKLAAKLARACGR